MSKVKSCPTTPFVGPHIQPKTAKRGRKRSSLEQILSTSDSRGKAKQFHEKCPWDAWHTEFRESRLPNGALRFPTAWSFAKSKTKDDKEQQWILDAIGPEPELKEGQKPAMPWLGDWRKIRQSGFWLRQDKTDALERAVTERMGALEAARVVSGFSISYLRRVEHLTEQLDNYFGDQVLHPEMSIKDNIARFTFVVKMLAQLQIISGNATHDFLACNGIESDDITVIARMEATKVLGVSPADQAEIQKIRLMPGVTAELINGMSQTDMRMAMTLVQKSKVFGFVLPDYEVPLEEQAACEEFITTFPVEEFSELKMFLGSCTTVGCLGESLETRIANFCKHSTLRTITSVWMEIENFNTLMSGQVFPRSDESSPTNSGCWSRRMAGCGPTFAEAFDILRASVRPPFYQRS